MRARFPVATGLLPSLLVSCLIAPSALATIKGFTEENGSSKLSAVSKAFNANTTKDEKPFLIEGGLRENYRKFSNRFRVPGMISATAIPEVATIIGPSNKANPLDLGATVYFRWAGGASPHVGDRFNTFTPAIVIQSLADPTDFQVKARPPTLKQIPDDFRMAGYFYEVSGTVRITAVNQGLVTGVVERLSGIVDMGDQLMPLLPVKQDLTPISGGIQLAAAVVTGSPTDHLSTSTRSFIYINRGARDGIKEGRIFQAVESIKLDGAISGPAPERSLGEAMVLYVTDSYSTAVITKQFEVIRIGALLKTKQEDGAIPDGSPMHGLVEGKGASSSNSGVPRTSDPSLSTEIPNMGDITRSQDPSLPDPGAAAKKRESSLSDLDSLEKNLKLNELTPAERTRLSRLSTQEKLDAPAEAASDDSSDDVTPQNSFGKPKVDPKKKAKKPVKNKNDEEELNMLMQQN